MCGINGFLAYGNHPVNEAEKLLNRMNDRLAHRGPDDRGIWIDVNSHVYFGHLRLSIIDLTKCGHQPMISAKGNIIIFNGEIYNYHELKEKYLPDVQLSSSSDTEILLLMYEKFGEKCVDYFNGMYTFVIWDAENKYLFIATDRAGKKPFYYTEQGGIFSFASEIKSLLELPWVKSETDEEALYHFLTYNLVPAPLTMFRDIKKLLPAHRMIVNQQGIRKCEPYWDVEYRHLENANEKELAEMLRDGLTASVKRRMISDVPVGAFLSGGVDSSAIVALMSGQTPHRIKTYSIGFDGQPDYDELKYAGAISRQFNTDHFEKIVSPSEITDFLPTIVDIFDEPMADATSIPIFFLSQKARQNGTIVVLTGDGSDELLAGYQNWMKIKRIDPYFKMFSSLPQPLKKLMAGVFISIHPHSPEAEIFSRGVNNQQLFWGGAKSFKESVKRKFLSEEFNTRTSSLNSYSVIDHFYKEFSKHKHERNDFDVTDWMCYLGFKFNIPNYYLYRMDRLGMANSVEIRTPFLDTEFVNLALSIPSKYKVKNGEPKYILKKALKGVLNDETLYRRKKGFNVPLKEWAGPMLTDYIETNLDSFCDAHPQFNKESFVERIKLLKAGNKDVANNLWTIYFLMAWFKRWMK
jgi:asparagine synthase (glutamine-hydrolysing)